MVFFVDLVKMKYVSIMQIAVRMRDASLARMKGVFEIKDDMYSTTENNPGLMVHSARKSLKDSKSSVKVVFLRNGR